MTFVDLMTPDIAALAEDLRARQKPFVFATLIRTVGATAAKPGAKALVDADGTILAGFLGGGCTRGAVKRAAQTALRTGQPQLVSVSPEDVLAEKGIAAGDTVDGVTFARNGCPSKGTIDLFIEPCLPMPELVIMGTSPVAMALAGLAPQFQWHVSTELGAGHPTRKRAVVVATQGKGDLDALLQALGGVADHIAFVGSHKKFAALSEKLGAQGIAEKDIARVKAPAGLDIGAVTAEEIALSILAELISVRRVALSGVTDGQM